MSLSFRNIKLKILIVCQDDNEGIYYKSVFEKMGCEAKHTSSLDNAQSILMNPKDTTILLLDVDFSDFMKTAIRISPSTGVFISTQKNEIRKATKLLEEGAYFYIVKTDPTIGPIQVDTAFLTNSVKDFISSDPYGMLCPELWLAMDSDFKRVLSQSIEHIDTRMKIDAMVRGCKVLLIQGESGTGKSLTFDMLCHKIILNTNKFLPFIEIDSKDVKDENQLIELFEKAKGGVLFLENIDDMLPVNQNCLTNTLESGFYHTGNRKRMNVDFKLVMSTRSGWVIKNTKISNDLLDRVDKSIFLDSLRWKSRKGDIKHLSSWLFKKYKNQYQKKQLEGIAPEALKLLEEYFYPRNVIDLNELIRASVILSTENVISGDMVRDMIIRLDNKHRDRETHESIDEQIKQIQTLSVERPGVMYDQFDRTLKKSVTNLSLFDRAKNFFLGKTTPLPNINTDKDFNYNIDLSEEDILFMWKNMNKHHREHLQENMEHQTKEDN